jgi:hypothetical protein
VLQQHEQQASGDPRQMAFLMLVLRELIGYSSGDALALAVLSAQRTLNMTDAEVKKMNKLLMNQASSAWPEGFM